MANPARDAIVRRGFSVVPFRSLAPLLAGLLAVASMAALPGPSPTALTWFRAVFAHPVVDADRAALDAVADVVLPSGARSYVVAAPASPVVDGAQVTALGPRDKVHTDALAGGRVQALAVGAAVPSAADLLGRSAAPSAIVDGLDVVAGDATPEVVSALAAIPGVLHVGPAPTGLHPEDEASAQVQAGHFDFDTAEPGYREWLQAVGVDGSGVRVSIVDTGIDRYHPDVADQVETRFDYSPDGEPNDLYGHGTHVAGIVAGTGESGGLSLGDPAGHLYGLGVAPGARLVDQNAIAFTTEEWPPPYGFGKLTADALDAGASIWNASWTTGEGAGAGYLATAAQLDALVRDGHAERQGSQPFTMVFSAGNSGASFETITSPKEAKNLIVVGSSDNVRTIRNRPRSAEFVSSFSSRGPARDGRILPTVLAPGANVLSARSTTPQGCNLPPQDAGASLYAFCSGTSMASPHVAGAVALIHDWWTSVVRRSGAPSPAMSKALLVNSATDPLYQDIPNPHEGWGRVDLGNLFGDGETPPPHREMVDQRTVLTDPGTAYTIDVDIVDPSEPLKITLAWTDPAAAPASDPTDPALVNDLDLVLTAPDGTTYVGNRFAKGRSLPGGAPDRVDNLENVFVADPQPGTWTVTVGAHALPGDGVPGGGDRTDQDFALVITNGDDGA